MERLRAQAMQREFGELYVERAGLALGQDRANVAAADLAQGEHLREKLDPFAFETVSEHATL
jgi:hypothetical protein